MSVQRRARGCLAAIAGGTPGLESEESADDGQVLEKTARVVVGVVVLVVIGDVIGVVDDVVNRGVVLVVAGVMIGVVDVALNGAVAVVVIGVVVGVVIGVVAGDVIVVVAGVATRVRLSGALVGVRCDGGARTRRSAREPRPRTGCVDPKAACH